MYTQVCLCTRVRIFIISHVRLTLIQGVACVCICTCICACTRFFFTYIYGRIRICSILTYTVLLKARTSRLLSEYVRVSYVSTYCVCISFSLSFSLALSFSFSLSLPLFLSLCLFLTVVCLVSFCKCIDLQAEHSVWPSPICH